MPMTFYPHQEDLETSKPADKLEVLLDAAERYKAAILDSAAKAEMKNRETPREIEHVFNWDEIAKLLRELREFPEGSPNAKKIKADMLKKLAEIYEVLRAAKMPKLEAVRLALINEAEQLKGGAA